MSASQIELRARINPPPAPIGCDTCRAVAGARCITTSGLFAAQPHACRQRAVRAFLEAQEAGVAPVGDIAAARARRRKRDRQQRQAGISTPVT